MGEYLERTRQTRRHFYALGNSDYPSKLTSADMIRLRAKYMIPDSVGLIVPDPNEQAYDPRPESVAVSEASLRVEFRLSINPSSVSSLGLTVWPRPNLI